jgi:glycosyltransferase involved in cell wall biosynthesis
MSSGWRLRDVLRKNINALLETPLRQALDPGGARFYRASSTRIDDLRAGFATPGRRSSPPSGGHSHELMASISVIIPTYNSGEFIVDTVESVLAQTLEASEILIVDDGSTDHTRALIEGIGDSRIRYVRQENAGVSVARNTGLSLATGEFIAFLDADDLWRPTMLEKQAALLNHDPGISCAFTNFVRFDHPEGTVLPDQFTFYPELSTLPVRDGPIPGTFVIQGDAFTALIGFYDPPGFTQVIMFRRSSIDGLAFDPTLRLNQDLPFVMRATMRGKVTFNTEVLADVRRHRANATINYEKLAESKLAALLTLRPHIDSESRRIAYEARLTRAFISAANLMCRDRRWAEGLRAYRNALGIPGSYARKLKGGIRLAWAISLSALPGRPGASRA